MGMSDEQAVEACYRGCCWCLSFTISLICLILFFTGAHPRVRISSISLETLKYSNVSSTPSFTMVFNAEFAVKNKNLIEVKIKSSKATVSYRGADVGTTATHGVDVGPLKKETFNVTLFADSDNVVSSNETRHLMTDDLKSKNLTFSTYAKFKSEVNWIFKKKSKMNCTFIVDIENKKVIPLKCK